MDTVKIIITDDDEFIHKDIRKSLNSIDFQYEIVEDFYDTDSLNRFLRCEDQPIDILLLDYDFGGNGNNGIEAIPEIKEYYPELPILMLTAYEDDIFDEARKKYRIGYIQKPVKATDLRFQIKSLIESMSLINDLQKQMMESKEFTDLIAEENDKLTTNLEMERASYVEAALPKKILDLIQHVFPDVEFLPKAFRYMVNGSVKDGDWKRVFRVLKVIDWKSEQEDAGSGIKLQKFPEGEKSGYKNMWEYRFSQAGRIFVERRKGETPLVVLIDPTHIYEKLTGRL